MKQRRNWLVVAGLSVLCVLIAAFFLWPRTRVHFLSQQLRKTKNPSEIITLVQKALQHDGDHPSSAVADYASESPLRAFHSRRCIFVLHDDSSGNIHIALGGPPGTLEVPADLSLSEEQREALERHVGQITGMSTVTSLGKPPLIFSGMHMLDEPGADPEHEKVQFVLKVKDQPEYRRIVFRFSGGRCVASRFAGVSDAWLKRWRSTPDWPEDWE